MSWVGEINYGLIVVASGAITSWFLISAPTNKIYTDDLPCTFLPSECLFGKQQDSYCQIKICCWTLQWSGMVAEAWLRSEIDDDCIIHDLLYIVLVIHFIMCQDLALLLVVELVKINFMIKKKHATICHLWEMQAITKGMWDKLKWGNNHGNFLLAPSPDIIISHWFLSKE